MKLCTMDIVLLRTVRGDRAGGNLLWNSTKKRLEERSFNVGDYPTISMLTMNSSVSWFICNRVRQQSGNDTHTPLYTTYGIIFCEKQLIPAHCHHRLLLQSTDSLTLAVDLFLES